MVTLRNSIETTWCRHESQSYIISADAAYYNLTLSILAYELSPVAMLHYFNFFKGIEAIKKQLRRSVLPKIEAALNAETDILMQRWTSSECQRNFGKYKVDKD